MLCTYVHINIKHTGEYKSIAHGYEIMHNGTFCLSCYMYIQHLNPVSQHEFIYKVCNYSFTIWYIVFYKHGGGTAIFKLI